MIVHCGHKVFCCNNAQSQAEDCLQCSKPCRAPQWCCKMIHPDHFDKGCRDTKDTLLCRAQLAIDAELQAYSKPLHHKANAVLLRREVQQAQIITSRCTLTHIHTKRAQVLCCCASSKRIAQSAQYHSVLDLRRQSVQLCTTHPHNCKQQPLPTNKITAYLHATARPQGLHGRIVQHFNACQTGGAAQSIQPILPVAARLWPQSIDAAFWRDMAPRQATQQQQFRTGLVH